MSADELIVEAVDILAERAAIAFDQSLIAHGETLADNDDTRQAVRVRLVLWKQQTIEQLRRELAAARRVRVQ